MTQPRSKEATTGRWSFMRRFVIGSGPDGPFLRRLRIIETPWCGLYLHHWDCPDSDADPHDHMWPFWSLILRGGYMESLHQSNRPTLLISRRRFSIHLTPLSVAHKVVRIMPKTTTLVFRLREVRDWGFWTPTGWVPWQDYLVAADPETAMS